jgi:phosphotransferase system enzyme I (PtsP)
MIAAVDEFDRARALIERELTHLRRHGHALPDTIRIGAMLEVPSLLFSLDEILERVDFLSVGSNDLIRSCSPAGRGNQRVAGRFDPLSPPLRLQVVIDAGSRLASRSRSAGGSPLAAGRWRYCIGYRGLSLSPPRLGREGDGARARYRGGSKILTMLTGKVARPRSATSSALRRKSVPV